jgi:tetratricopeptide (TPR) repeat protein
MKKRAQIMYAHIHHHLSALQPLDENIVSYTAQFIIKVKQDHERALQLLRGLTKTSPQRARSFRLLAEFYHTVKKDVPSAVKIYQKVCLSFRHKKSRAQSPIFRRLPALGPRVKSATLGQVLRPVSVQKLMRINLIPHIATKGCHALIFRYEKAVHAYRQGLALDRGNADAVLSMADTLHKRMGRRFVHLQHFMNQDDLISELRHYRL